jgi:hypothetical protein
MRVLRKSLLLFVVAIVFAGHADVVLRGNVAAVASDSSLNRNIPMRFYLSTGLNDTAKDKIAYTDSNGNWSITFKGITSGQFAWVNALGTKLQYPKQYSDNYFQVTTPTSKGDTFEISNGGADGAYLPIEASGFSQDSIIIKGSIVDGTSPATGIDGATVTAKFHNYAFDKDTSLTTTTDIEGSFQFPVFFNNSCYIKVEMIFSRNGYLTIDTQTVVSGVVLNGASNYFNWAGPVWDGKTDSIVVNNLKMYTGTTQPDSTDSIIVIGTIKDSAGTTGISGAKAMVCIGTDSNTYIDSTSLITVDASGNYSAKIRNKTKLSHVFYKVTAGFVTGYVNSAIKKDTTIVAGNAINDTILGADFYLKKTYTFVDTLVITGTITDSVNENPNRPINKVIVAIKLATSEAGLTTSSTTVTCTTNVNGIYCFKYYNSAQITKIYGILNLSDSILKAATSDQIHVKASTPEFNKQFIPNDGINDTVKVDATMKLKLITGILNPALRYASVKVKTPVSIYDLSGRLIKSFLYESSGSMAGLPKYLKTIGIQQPVCVVRISGTSGFTRKMMLNLR